MNAVSTIKHPADHPDSLKKQLDRWLEVEFSHIDTAKICARLFGYAPAHRQLLAECIKRISATNVQLAHYFVERIDERAAEYLPQLYGQANYTVLKEVAHLPLKISDIYRKLTT